MNYTGLNPFCYKQLLSKAGICLLALSMGLNSYSQQTQAKIKLATVLVAEMQSKETTSANFSNSKNLQGLLTQHNEAVYLSGSAIKTYGAKPKLLVLNLTDFNQLASAEIVKDNIELIQLTVNQLPAGTDNLDFSVLNPYKKLKYMHFIVQEEQTIRDLAARIPDADRSIELLYSIVNTTKD